MEEYSLELMVKIANSIAAITTSCRQTIVIAIVFLTIHFCAKNFWHNHHLPAVFTFFHRNRGSKDTLYCVVCLHEVTDGERFRRLPKCSHCFDVWFHSHSTCPLRRTNVISSCLVNDHRHKQHGLRHQFLSFLHLFLGKNM